MKTVLLLTFIAFASCRTLEQEAAWRAEATAGHIGCFPQEIQTSEPERQENASVTIWTASCHGKAFVCTSRPTQSGDQIDCAPSVQ
jgi:hypothetical protein